MAIVQPSSPRKFHVIVEDQREFADVVDHSHTAEMIGTIVMNALVRGSIDSEKSYDVDRPDDVDYIVVKEDRDSKVRFIYPVYGPHAETKDIILGAICTALDISRLSATN